MNKNLTTVQSPTIAPASWPDQTRIVRLADHLDSLVGYAAKFKKLLSGSEQWMSLQDAEQITNYYEISGCQALASKIEARVDAIEPVGWYDDEGGVSLQSVSVMLAALVGSFPTSNLPDAATFTKVMLADVVALEPSFVVLESACRAIRHTKKFMPAISELIDVIKKEKKVWSQRYDAMDSVEYSYRALKERIETKRAVQSRQVVDKLTSFEIGAKVSHHRFGAGIVSDLDGNKVSVVFDRDGSTRKIIDRFLDAAPA